jgi:predicted lipid-binding transport protein (Tim44 family)
LIWLALLAAALALVAPRARASRPGSGQDYSSPSRSPSPSPSPSPDPVGSTPGGASSDDSGEDGGLFFLFLVLLAWLCVKHPKIGVPLLVAIAGYVAWLRWRGRLRKGARAEGEAAVKAMHASWVIDRVKRDGPKAPPAAAEPPPVRMRVRAGLSALRARDPDFSRVLFEDFLVALYVRAHEARASGEHQRLAAYLHAGARAALERMPAARVTDIIVGALRIVAVSERPLFHPTHDEVEVLFESNYREGEGARLYQAVERWTLTRKRGVASRAPGGPRTFGCPECGSFYERGADDRCAHCGQRVVPSDFDWGVEAITVVERSATPVDLRAEVPEVGTGDPTLVDPGAAARLEEVRKRVPGFTWPAFELRVRRIFAALQEGWSEQREEKMRRFVSDGLYQVQRYWIDAYRRAKLRNVTEDARVVTVTVANAESDAHFDAITVRVFATGLDYTLDAAGELVKGSKTVERPYSEYWTLVRGAGAAQPAACPNCGAALAGLAMAEICHHCGTKVVGDDFDWVLSRIEQDESFALGA